MEYQIEKVRYISHEVKNQLSICDLYAEIISKYCAKNNIKDETITNAVKSIKNALVIAGNSMNELKSTYSFELGSFNVSELLQNAVQLSKVYGVGVNVNLNISDSKDVTVLVDKNIFIGVIINIIKNACEAFEDEEEKNIKISTILNDKKIKIIISNNAKPIENPDEIFKEGITTKTTGSGIGLYLAKNNMEKMSGNLKLLKSDNISTDFEIELKTI